ncbi:uncharacterized protein LOC108135051 isoform X5 [Drosophila elegans]|uniref:uncharacterized protein LOC108135051 isoform X5 n=1 Tax=Drosophila elegans TaxID=30023 RepID=UPI0007E78844|nr:uncharacterized protein LOC108135051 isoform X5 [Drosophila elegans]
MGRIFGGDFGSVEPGRSETVSLVWPTVSLYNRVGSCPILISATCAHDQDAVATAKQVLHFDTRFETLDPQSNKLRRRKGFKDCHNWDKDYLRNCTPLNCEERYFGQRSFFNVETEQCERASDCSRPGEYYDIFSNEAIETGNFVSEDELELIKQGKFDSNYLELRGPSPHEPSEDPAYPLSKQSRKQAHLKDVQSLEDSVNVKKLVKKSPFEIPLLTQLYYDWYLPMRADNWGEASEFGAPGEPSPQTAPSGSPPLIDWISRLDGSGWILLILKGTAIILLLIMFQIFATLMTYFLVCLAVYGFMEIYTFWTSDSEAADTLMGDSNSQTSNFVLVTSESLMSQR